MLEMRVENSSSLMKLHSIVWEMTLFSNELNVYISLIFLKSPYANQWLNLKLISFEHLL